MALLSLGGVCLLLSCLAAAAGNDVPVTTVTVKEDNDIVLNCLNDMSVRDKMFDWKKDKKEVFSYNPRDQACKDDIYGKCQRHQDTQFKQRVTYFDESLDSGNASIKIQGATLEDTGNYTCSVQSQGDAPTPVSRISLTVGRCPTLSFKETYRPGKATLKCEVNGAVPQPTIEWRDSSGSRVNDEEPEFKLNKDGLFDGTLETSVTQNGTYYCVVTQEDICHQTKEARIVDISGSSTPWIVITIVLSILLCVSVTLGVFCYCRKDKKLKSIKSSIGDAESKSLKDSQGSSS